MRPRMFGNQLAVRPFFYSVLIGSMLSVFSTGLQLLLSHQHQRAEAAQVVDQVDEALAHSLEPSLQRSDVSQVDIILEGLATNELVSHINLRSATGQTWERGERTGSDVMDVYDLVFGHR